MKTTRNLGIWRQMFDVGDVFVDHTRQRSWRERLFSRPWKPLVAHHRYRIVAIVNETTVEIEDVK